MHYSRHSSRSTKTPSAATTPTGASNTRAQHRAALAAAAAAAKAEQQLQQQQQQPQQQQQQLPAKHAGFCEICEHHFDHLSAHLASNEHAVAVGLKDWSVLDRALQMVNTA